MSVNALRGIFILFGIFNPGYSIIVYMMGTLFFGEHKTQDLRDSDTILGSILENSMSKYISGNATTESKHAQTMTVDDLPTLGEDEAYHSLSFVGSEEADVTDQVKDEPSVSEGLSTIRDELGSNNMNDLVETDTGDVWDDESKTDGIWGEKTKSIWDEEKPNIWE